MCGGERPAGRSKSDGRVAPEGVCLAGWGALGEEDQMPGGKCVLSLLSFPCELVFLQPNPAAHARSPRCPPAHGNVLCSGLLWKFYCALARCVRFRAALSA